MNTFRWLDAGLKIGCFDPASFVPAISTGSESAKSGIETHPVESNEVVFNGGAHKAHQ